MANWLVLLFFTASFLLYFAFWYISKIKGEPPAALTKELQEGARGQRQELGTALRENREELQKTMLQFTQPLTSHLQQVIQNQERHAPLMQQKLEEGLRTLLQEAHKINQEGRQDVKINFSELQAALTQGMQDLRQFQKEKLDGLREKQEELTQHMRVQLEKVRLTVDEKLHKTLEERLGRSFHLVSHRLEAVQKGLGEMQQLAHDVGNLKNVLTNVKTRGIVGEIQLETILAEVLTPQQYATNVQIHPDSKAHVEFAIKLPGKEDSHPVLLPIDAKFPQETYIRLQSAQEKGTAQAMEVARKEFFQAIKKFARDIRTKYLAPPHTTDFGIMFLPTESLFAEALHHPDLLTALQRDYKIILTGPTTLAAMLNSLQMGFKTLAIQKRSSEVWEILAAVKTEFAKFGTILEKTQTKLHEANTELDKLVGQRTRMMLAKLKKIEHLPMGGNKALGE